jgi:hypothetical protein
VRALFVSILSCVFLATLAVSAGSLPANAAPPPRPVVLVLVEGLSWENVNSEPGLQRAFRDGAAATLSVVQGTAPPDDPRFGYVFLGAGSRVDTRFLPEQLPTDQGRIPDAFDGPARTVHPGSLGGALEEAGVQAAAVGDKARLVVMTPDGEVPRGYEGPIAGLDAALEDGAGFVAVDAVDPRQAAQLVEAARETGATVAVASPNGPKGTPNLTPFTLVGPGKGLLYSPVTRTEGLLTNADVAPTLLDALGAPVPPEMSGRAAEVRPGDVESAELLQRRLWLVEDKGFQVWGVVGVLWALTLAVGTARRGRRGVSWAVLALAALPAGALLAAAFPVTEVLSVGALTALFAAGMTSLSWRLSGSFAGAFAGALAGIALATAALVTLDAAAGGALERFSTIGYNPATGTRFYGVGNEYAAVLAGSLTLGLGVLTHRRRPPAVPLAAVGVVAVLALGLPTMGADVGGSLALGLAFGATVGLVRDDGWRGATLWAAGGFALAAALFLASGLLFPDVSHGSSAAAGREDLYEVFVRKVALSLGSLLNPVLLLLTALGGAVTYAGWRRARGAPLAAAIPGAVVAAVASGVFNDTSLVAALFALMYPALGALGVLVSKENAGPRRSFPRR